VLKNGGKIITAFKVKETDRKIKDKTNKSLKQLALAYLEVIKSKPSNNTKTIPKSQTSGKTTNKTPKSISNIPKTGK